MKNKPNEFTEVCKIDVESLDVECARQAETFIEYAQKAIDARSVFDRAKEHVEYIEAKLQVWCWKDPSAFEIAKPTVGLVNAAVRKHKKYVAALEAQHVAREKSAILDKVVAALEIRKRMLETLVTLHGQQYFAGPAAPRNLKQHYMLQQKRRDERVNDRVPARKRLVKKGA